MHKSSDKNLYTLSIGKRRAVPIDNGPLYKLHKKVENSCAGCTNVQVAQKFLIFINNFCANCTFVIFIQKFLILLIIFVHFATEIDVSIFHKNFGEQTTVYIDPPIKLVGKRG